MKHPETFYEELAVKIYELDEKAYRLVGSSLGRTLIGGREKAIWILRQELRVYPQNNDILRVLALIGKMARTIQDHAARKAVMEEYNSIIVAVKTIESTEDAYDIGDRNRISLNPFAAGTKKFTTDDRLVICIGRSYGSGGNDIGFHLADDLHINYYDATIFRDVIERLQAEKEAADQSQLEQMLTRLRELKGLRLFTSNLNRYHGLPASDALYFNQSRYIEDRAKKEDFVVMGRCADVILRNAAIPHVSIFITAPLEMRVRRVMELEKIPYREAARIVRREDQVHRRFYRRYTGLEWGNAIHYDLCINSASYGIEESEELMIRVIKARVRDDLALTALEHEQSKASAANALAT